MYSHSLSISTVSIGGNGWWWRYSHLIGPRTVLYTHLHRSQRKTERNEMVSSALETQQKVLFQKQSYVSGFFTWVDHSWVEARLDLYRTLELTSWLPYLGCVARKEIGRVQAQRGQRSRCTAGDIEKEKTRAITSDKPTPQDTHRADRSKLYNFFQKIWTYQEQNKRRECQLSTGLQPLCERTHEHLQP